MNKNTQSPHASQVHAILAQSNALLSNDHFVYISGDHGSGWIDKDAIFINPQNIRSLTQLLADAVKHLAIDMVCGPATGGLIVAQWTAYALGLPAIFAEHGSPHLKSDIRGNFELHRGFDRLAKGKRILVVDDVINTGHSVMQTLAAVRSAGATVPAVAALVHRGNIDAAGMCVDEYIYLAQCDIPRWPANKCPLCASRTPINTLYAHGQDFLDAQQQSQQQ